MVRRCDCGCVLPSEVTVYEQGESYVTSTEYCPYCGEPRRPRCEKCDEKLDYSRGKYDEKTPVRYNGKEYHKGCSPL